MKIKFLIKMIKVRVKVGVKVEVETEVKILKTIKIIKMMIMIYNGLYHILLLYFRFKLQCHQTH
jgi:hypothetical protein